LFSPYDDLPLPSYLEQESLEEPENYRSLLRCFVSQEHLATLSKHELLFGVSKQARYWQAGIL